MVLLVLQETESLEELRREILKISPSFEVDKIEDALRADKQAKPLSKPLP